MSTTKSIVGMVLSGSLTVVSQMYPPDVTYSEVSVPTLARPSYLTPVIDPAFGAKIIRITDATVFGVSDFTHHYSKDQPWNCDETLIKLNEGDNNILNGTTYQIVKTLGMVSSETVWSCKDPNMLFGRSGNRFYSENATTGAMTLLHTFADYADIALGPSEGNVSINDSTVAFLADYKDIVVYDIPHNQIIAIKSLSSMGYSGSGDVIDWVSVSQSGKYVVICGGESSDPSVKSYDCNLDLVATLFAVGEHGDIGYDASGNEVFVQVGVSGGPCSMARLDNGQVTTVFQSGLGQSGHMSCRNYKRPGWCYLSMASRKEMVAIKLDGSQKVERFTFHRSSEATYYAEAHGVPSPDGARVMFKSDWNGTAEINSYVAWMPEATGVNENSNSKVSRIPEFIVESSPLKNQISIKYAGELMAGSVIAIYDSKGKKVADLTGQFHSNHAVWNASNRASGVYYFVLRSGIMELKRSFVLAR